MKTQGVFYENYVACELSAKDIELFYWCGKNQNEFEFIVIKDGQIIPIDVKKNKGKLNSLDNYRYVAIYYRRYIGKIKKMRSKKYGKQNF